MKSFKTLVAFLAISLIGIFAGWILTALEFDMKSFLSLILISSSLLTLVFFVEFLIVLILQVTGRRPRGSWKVSLPTKVAFASGYVLFIALISYSALSGKV